MLFLNSLIKIVSSLSERVRRTWRKETKRKRIGRKEEKGRAEGKGGGTEESLYFYIYNVILLIWQFSLIPVDNVMITSFAFLVCLQKGTVFKL